MNYKHEWIANNVIVTYSGVITKDDIINSMNLTVSDSRFGASRFQISDFTNVQEMNLEENVFDILLSTNTILSQCIDRIKIASISTDEQITNKIMDCKKTKQGVSFKTQVFSNLEEALRWGYRR